MNEDENLFYAAKELIELTQGEQLAIRARRFAESTDVMAAESAHMVMKCSRVIQKIERFFRRYPHLR